MAILTPLVAVTVEQPSRFEAFSFVVITILGVVSAFLGFAQLVRPDTVVLNHADFTVTDIGGLRKRTYRWIDVKDIRPWQFQAGFATLRMIRFDALKPGTTSRWEDVTFFSRYGPECEELAHLMNLRRNEATEDLDTLPDHLEHEDNAWPTDFPI